MRKKQLSVDLEKALAELEGVVTRMEQGELSLEESLKHYERGVILRRSCQQALNEAEQKVEILMSDKNVPFSADENKAGADVTE